MLSHNNCAETNLSGEESFLPSVGHHCLFQQAVIGSMLGVCDVTCALIWMSIS